MVTALLAHMKHHIAAEASCPASQAAATAAEAELGYPADVFRRLRKCLLAQHRLGTLAGVR